MSPKGRPGTPTRAGQSQAPEGATARVGGGRRAVGAPCAVVEGARESALKREARR
jgi:hypothetical protein